MYTSFYDLFSIGLGPSSSHTMGPMRAACRFAEGLRELASEVRAVQVRLYGSLALTGEGHGTPGAVVYGLMGLHADSPELAQDLLSALHHTGQLRLATGQSIPFSLRRDITLCRDESLPEHPNGMRFTALDAEGCPLKEEVYFSIGGGAIRRQDEMGAGAAPAHRLPVPYSFTSCRELIALCEREGMSMAELILCNEAALRPVARVHERVALIARTMREAIERGITREGELPGGLRLARRAPQIYHRLEEKFHNNDTDALMIVDWINLWAFAVAEENASGGRVVTAPTMGSAGVVPAVLRYFERYGYKESPFSPEEGIEVFLLTASAICCLYRANASISGAEVGCQGEVGVACSMAAAGLTAAMGGTLGQVENAAEIAMEHNLGLTCDPICGLVQVPCIERNAIGAVKAVNAARLAMRGDGSHYVSLDSVIATMYETGRHLPEGYRETSLAGLAKHC